MGNHKPADTETCLQIIDWIAKGLTVKKAVAEIEPEPTKRDSLARNFFAAMAVSPDMAQHYARAQRARAQADFERIGELAERVAEGEVDPQAARVAIDAWKWSAGRMDPKKYGDKVLFEANEDRPGLSRAEALAALQNGTIDVGGLLQRWTKPAEPIEAEAEAKTEETAQAAQSDDFIDIPD